MKPALPERQSKGHWVQTERAAHEAWSNLIARNANAARLMHLLVARVGDNNAVVISQKALAKLLEVTDRTVRNSVALLAEENWLEVRQIGPSGTVNAYVINDRVAWTGKRDSLRFSLFSATVIAASDEQIDRAEIEADKPQAPLRRIPSLFSGEKQLPSGPGLPPISQPSFPGMEPDLPAIDRATSPDFDHEE